MFAFSDTSRYSRVLHRDDRYGLLFEAELPSSHRFEGVDLARRNDDGLASELRAMMRPLAPMQEFAHEATSLVQKFTG